MSTIRIAIAGIHGQMGRALAAAIAGDERFDLCCGVIRHGSLASGTTGASPLDPALPLVTDVRDIPDRTRVVLDFTTPDATIDIASACAARGVSLVSGTTSLDAARLDKLRQIACEVAVVWSANMSVGIAAIRGLIPDLARVLGGYDVEIIETHHRRKVDAPSGTALELARAVVGGEGCELEVRAVYGRQGRMPRSPSDIGLHAVRAGGDPGSHTVVFGGDSDQVTISHRAFGRECYAQGGLEAAAFVATGPPGFYSMTDVIAARTV